MADINKDTNISLIDKECFIPPLEAVPFEYQIFLIIIYSITALIALLGNITVIIVESFGKHSANNLRKFLINLAISDISIGVLCVPFSYTDFMLGKWIFPHWLCPAAQFVQLLSVFVTSFTLTIIGAERYMATLYPFSLTYEWLSSHSNCLLYLSWILGSVYSSTWLTHTETVSFELNNTTYYECRYDTNDLTPFKRNFYAANNFILTFALPLIVLVLSYTAITRKLLSDSLGDKESALRRNTQIKNRYKPIKMMFVVVLFYGICWMPIKTYQIVLNFWPNLFQFCSPTEFYVIVGIYFSCHFIAMSSSFMNPIIYSFMSRSFRKDFHRITRLVSIRKLSRSQMRSKNQSTSTNV